MSFFQGACPVKLMDEKGKVLVRPVARVGGWSIMGGLLLFQAKLVFLFTRCKAGYSRLGRGQSVKTSSTHG